MGRRGGPVESTVTRAGSLRTVTDDSLLLDALSWVDLAIFAEVQRVRARGRALAKDAPWGAFVGEAEVDEILGDLLDVGPFRLDPELGDELRTLVATRRAEIEARFAESRLGSLAGAFGLGPDDLALLLLALAPEVNERYLRLFAYLQDDVAAQFLTPGLALRLLGETRAARVGLRSRFAPDAPLVRHHLVLMGAADAPLPARSLMVAPRIARWVLSGEAFDPSLASFVERVDGQEGRPALAAIVDGLLAAAGDDVPVLQLDARSARDAREAAGHLALRRGCPLLVADLAAAERLGIDPSGPAAAALVREARLQGAALLVLEPDESVAALIQRTAGAPQPLLVHGSVGEATRRVLTVPVPGLTLAERRDAWTALLAELGVDLDAAALARRFRFSPGQIAQVLDDARDRAAGRGLAKPDAEAVLAACGESFLPDPGPLAERVPARRSWDELILPSESRELLDELVSQIERREQVLEAFGDRLRPGERGIQALFSGPPGTGKSMAAEVIAHSLGFPLFRVDLSSVVSKYVGETEKHLGRVLDAAEDAPCVLLFDEADALFGKRGEVRGGQDRFANLEVSYLLQRLEAFDGVAILTSNLKRNIDEAFLRRFTFVVDFPFPEADERRRIWERVLPIDFPLAADVSVHDVASEFKLAGANIFSVAVAAACAAAETEEREITRGMLAHAVRREYAKLGRDIAALRPALLQGASSERPDRARRAPSAAEARRRRGAPPKE